MTRDGLSECAMLVATAADRSVTDHPSPVIECPYYPHTVGTLWCWKCCYIHNVREENSWLLEYTIQLNKIVIEVACCPKTLLPPSATSDRMPIPLVQHYKENFLDERQENRRIRGFYVQWTANNKPVWSRWRQSQQLNIHPPNLHNKRTQGIRTL